MWDRGVSVFFRVLFWEVDEDLPADLAMLFDLNGIYCMNEVSALLLYVVRIALDLDRL